ncbi:MAG: hypothetical protein IJ470_03615 [Clostridia bacterium]|nr:hypothetical protein [Clostridia bacterium]
MKPSMSIQELRAIYMQKYEENKELVDARIAEGIETYRKGDCCVQIKDKQGNPIACKKIKVTQVSHDFKYGANLFLLDEFKNDKANA